jgi:hypothetical protein
MFAVVLKLGAVVSGTGTQLSATVPSPDWQMKYDFWLLEPSPHVSVPLVETLLN